MIIGIIGTDHRDGRRIRMMGSSGQTDPFRGVSPDDPVRMIFVAVPMKARKKLSR
jgi:hypothetical protein